MRARAVCIYVRDHANTYQSSGRPSVSRLHLAKHVIEQKMKGSLAV